MLYKKSTKQDDVNEEMQIKKKQIAKDGRKDKVRIPASRRHIDLHEIGISSLNQQSNIHKKRIKKLSTRKRNNKQTSSTIKYNNLPKQTKHKHVKYYYKKLLLT